MSQPRILGGTRFVGRVIVETLIEQGFTDITLFVRGVSNPDIFPELPRIIGDRETDDIQKLSGKTFDVVIDVSGYYPLSLEKLTHALKKQIGRYIYISTVSVYDMEKTVNQLVTEESPVLPCTEEQKHLNIMQAYGELKAECERVLLASGINDVLIFRLSLVYGRYDPFDRFYYWKYRIKHRKTEPILLPGGGHFYDAFTYVADIGKVVAQAIATPKHRQIYNLSTHDVMSFKDMLNGVAHACQTQPNFVDIPYEWLRQNGYDDSDCPLCADQSYLMITNNKLRRDFNPNFTPFVNSISEAMQWRENHGWLLPKTGTNFEKEQSFINRFRA